MVDLLLSRGGWHRTSALGGTLKDADLLVEQTVTGETAFVDLPVIFALVAAGAVALYVLADGFDLGIGILFLLAPREQDRDIMMESVAPLWDGNETWLVFGGALLWAAFPIAYYVLLPAFYLPLIVMLFALILRGVAFEFRFQATLFRRGWDFAFACGV